LKVIESKEIAVIFLFNYYFDVSVKNGQHNGN